MSVRQKGQQYEVSYRCPGYPKPFYERFPDIETANFRDAQIKFELKQGTFSPPAHLITKTKPAAPPKNLRDYLDEFVRLYGLNNWGDTYLSMSEHYIKDYIDPYIGDLLLKDITPHVLDVYYDSLQSKPAVTLKGQESREKTVSIPVIQKIHVLLRKAFAQAVQWDYIPKNPATDVTLPKQKKKKRAAWTSTEVIQALSCCDNPLLKLAMLLAMVGSMRIGEILGLKWENVEIYDQSAPVQDSLLTGTKGPNTKGAIHVRMELKRCQKSAVEALKKKERDAIYFIFPNQLKSEGDASTVLALKAPKTESSIRTLYIEQTTVDALLAAKAQQELDKQELGAEYQDYGLVLAHKNGRPLEAHTITKYLNQLIEAHQLRPVVFHSLRHTSTSVKLILSGGDIKAVQGDTGHADASMVTDQYSFVEDLNRRTLASKFEQQFLSALQPAHLSTDQDCGDPDLVRVIELLERRPDLVSVVLSLLEKMCA